MYILDQDGKNLFNTEQFFSIGQVTMEWLKKPFIIQANIVTVNDKKSFNLGQYKDESKANEIFKSMIRSVKAGDEVFVMPEE